MVRSFLPVEPGVHWDGHLEWQTVGGRQAVPEDNAGNEAALHSLPVLDGDIASVDERLLLGVPLGVDTRAASEEGDESLTPAGLAQRSKDGILEEY